MGNITKDKNNKPIMVGDVLKVFHFIGARRKKYYMYKHVIGFKQLGGLGGKPKVDYFEVSHLNMNDIENYHIHLHEGILLDYEIVQGLDDIEDRQSVI